MADDGVPAQAHLRLAKLYEDGNGVAQTFSESIAHYEAAAELGSALAQTQLGLKHLGGLHGAPVSLEAC